MTKVNFLFLAVLLLSSTYVSHISEVSADLNKVDTMKIYSALDKGVLYLENSQSPTEGELGEFATYTWEFPNQSDIKYVSTLFTTPFVLHTLNYLQVIHENIAEVGKPAFENMRLLAGTHILNNIETVEGHTGVWSFFGPGGTLPPDFCDTCCNVECLTTLNPNLWGEKIDRDLLDYFLEYKKPDGAFVTWMDGNSTDVCAGTNANILFLYGSRDQESKIQSTIDWLNDQLERVRTGQPYEANYYLSPYAFTYLATRAYSDGGAQTFLNFSQREKIREYILDRQEEDGSWPICPEYGGSEDTLETSLAIVSTINLGYSELSSTEREKIEKGIEYLLNKQSPDGSWPCGCFYIEPHSPNNIQFGSSELTTAICMEALAKYAVSNEGNNTNLSNWIVPLFVLASLLVVTITVALIRYIKISKGSTR